MPTLRELREGRGLSAAQVAYELGVRRATVADWESGAARPRPIHVLGLGDLLGVSPREVIAATAWAAWAADRDPGAEATS